MPHLTKEDVVERLTLAIAERDKLQNHVRDLVTILDNLITKHNGLVHKVLNLSDSTECMFVEERPLLK